MIVLDEHLTDESLKNAIARWHQGRVAFIKTLRLGTLIKDDAIPTILQQLKQPTFVTIDWRDFWRRFSADERYCIICFAFELKRCNEIPNLLRRLLSLAPFKTKNNRMGTVIRVTKHTVQYYRCKDSRIYTLSI